MFTSETKCMTATTIAQCLRSLSWRTEGYLDPGTGSYLVQILMAGLLGAAFAVKTFWANIKAFFRGKQSK